MASPRGTEQTALYYRRLVVDAAGRQRVADAQAAMQKLCAAGFQPDLLAYNALLTCLCEADVMDAALALFEQAQEPALHPEFAGIQTNAASYGVLVAAFAARGDLPQAERFARDMDGRGFVLPANGFTELMRACLAQGDTRRAHRWGKAMNAAGFKKMNKAVMTSMVQALAKEGNTVSANYWLSHMAGLGIKLDVATYEIVRAAYPVEVIPAVLSGENVGQRCIAMEVRPPVLGGEVGIFKKSAVSSKNMPAITDGLDSAGQNPKASPRWLSNRGARGAPLTPRRRRPWTSGVPPANSPYTSLFEDSQPKARPATSDSKPANQSRAVARWLAEVNGGYECPTRPPGYARGGRM